MPIPEEVSSADEDGKFAGVDVGIEDVEPTSVVRHEQAEEILEGEPMHLDTNSGSPVAAG